MDEAKLVYEQSVAGFLGSIPLSVIAIGFFWRSLASFTKFKDEVLKSISLIDKNQAIAQKDFEHAAKVIDIVSEHAKVIAKMQADLNSAYERIRKLEER